MNYNHYFLGIKDFCTFLRTKIALTADKNLKSAISSPPADKRHTIIYADTLILLFEGLARVIDTHQPLLETYYGPGRLLSAVNILQKECDKQVKRIVLEWGKTRQIQRKIQVILIETCVVLVENIIFFSKFLSYRE